MYRSTTFETKRMVAAAVAASHWLLCFHMALSHRHSQSQISRRSILSTTLIPFTCFIIYDEDARSCAQAATTIIPSTAADTTIASVDNEEAKKTMATTTAPSKGSLSIDTADLRNLVYEKVLGSGSFKTVYQVSTRADESSPASYHHHHHHQSYALAVQRLRNKADVKDGWGGIRIAEQLYQKLAPEKRGEHYYFEQVLDWWFQSSPPLAFDVTATAVAHQPVFTVEMMNDRTRNVPHRFLGSKYLCALKPLYCMDLRKFCQKTPTMYTIPTKVSTSTTTSGDLATTGDDVVVPSVLAGIPLTDQGALTLTREILHAGQLLHRVGLVHRDIKPKNIMLTHEGKPVVIDFGFSEFVDAVRANDDDDDHHSGSSRRCIEQPGRVKGEVDYVLAPDVARYQGCQEGDAYALGKTLFEVLFEESSGRNGGRNTPSTSTVTDHGSSRHEITVEAAQMRNDQFRARLDSDLAMEQSRFALSHGTAAVLGQAIRGLCRADNPLSCAQAEALLVQYSSQQQQQQEH